VSPRLLPGGLLTPSPDVPEVSPIAVRFLWPILSVPPRGAIAGAVVVSVLAAPASALAQQWNGARALELVERAQTARQAVQTDPDFLNYRAEAQGFVYFFIDRPDTDERTLVKTDQVALEVYWQAPRSTKQRIVGLRDRKDLPTNIHYHLDHLTVVQDDFQDRIRLGDGDEVFDVLHPAAPEAENVYDYRLSDSLTVRLPGDGGEIRVYELEVRPKDMDTPGFVGSVFLDRATAAIVRMRFTFTPASYVDPYLDYIRISLDNMLWAGGHWLPYRQEAELRRELPVLDFKAGTIIRGRFEIGAYEFNAELPPGLFAGTGVSSLPEAERRAYPFRDSIYSHLEEEGLDTPLSLNEIREQAREIVEDRYLSGLARLRLHLPSVSSAVRYNRAEGSFVGVGMTLRPSGDWSLKTHVGYPFGRERPAAFLQLQSDEERMAGFSLEGYLNRLEDVGPVPGASGALNTLSALTMDEDWLDPYFTEGLSVRLARNGSLPFTLGGAPSIELRFERHRTATLTAGGDPSHFRPVRPAEEGNLLSLVYHLRWGAGADATNGWGLEADLGPRRFEDRWFWTAGLTGLWARTGAWRTVDVQARFDAGTTGNRAPPQAFFLLGGRETLLGHPYRAFVGRHFWLLRTEVDRPLAEPWVSARAFASAGQASGLAPTVLHPGWTDLEPDGGPLVSVGAGISFLWDVIRIDFGRGLAGDGEWDTALSVVHRFRRWL